MTWRALAPPLSGRLAVVLLVCSIAACRSDRADEKRPAPIATATEHHVLAGASGSSLPPRTDGSASGGAMLPTALPRFAGGEMPVYPEISRRLGEEGVVELRIQVENDGSVVSLGLSASSGHARLDAAALAAAQTWRFNPRTGGRGVDVIVHRVVFRLVEPR